MIKVHRLDGSQLVLNADLIETVEATPETIIRLLNGKVYVVKEGLEELLDDCLAYRRELYNGLGTAASAVLPARWIREHAEEPT